MEEIIGRMSKRHLMLAVLIILLTVTAGFDDVSSVSKETESCQSRITGYDTYKMVLEVKEERINPKGEVEATPKVDPKVVAKTTSKVATKVKAIDKNSDENWETYRLTHYVADCEGCSGITRAEIDVRNTTTYLGYKVLAVDKSIIPLGSIVSIKDGDSTYKAIAIDTGGAIKGKKLDLLVGSAKEAKKLGVKQVELSVVREGW